MVVCGMKVETTKFPNLRTRSYRQVVAPKFFSVHTHTHGLRATRHEANPSPPGSGIKREVLSRSVTRSYPDLRTGLRRSFRTSHMVLLNTCWFSHGRVTAFSVIISNLPLSFSSELRSDINSNSPCSLFVLLSVSSMYTLFTPVPRLQ